jgi:hypothetical protein
MFGKVQNQIERHEAMITSLWKGVPNVRRLERCATTPVDKLVDKNEDEEVKDFNYTSFI